MNKKAIAEAFSGYGDWMKKKKTPSSTANFSSGEITALYKAFDQFRADGTKPQFENGRIKVNPVDLSGFDQNVLSRMKSDYQSGWGTAYNLLDPIDTARRTNKAMPTSYASKYTDSNEDLWLYSQGLPSYADFTKAYNSTVETIGKETKKNNYLGDVMQAWTRGGAYENTADEDTLKALRKTISDNHGDDFGLSFEDLQKAYLAERQRIGAARTSGENQRIYQTNMNRYAEQQAALAEQEAEKQRVLAYDVPAAEAERKAKKGEYSLLDYIRTLINVPSRVQTPQNIVDARAERDAITKLDTDISTARQAQTLAKYEAETQNPDFAKYNYAPASYKFSANRDNQIYNYVNDLSGTKKAFSDAAMSGQTNPFEHFNYITDGERKLYNYILSTKGVKSGTEYMNALEKELSARYAQDLSGQVERFAKEVPVGSDIASVLATFAQPEGMLYSIGQTLQGKEIDPNNPRFGASMVKSGIRGTRTEQIKSDVLDILYNTGMSFADSLAAGLATGGGTGAGILLGVNAAGDATRDAVQRGADSGQAVLAGGFAGLAEAVFEKIGIDELFKIPSKAAKGALILTTLRQAGVEGTEEALTEISNTITDALIMGGKSSYETAVRNYIAQGMTEQEARQKAGTDIAANIGISFISGALMGGISGGGAYGVGRMQNAEAPTTEQQGFALTEDGTPVMEQAAPQEVVATDSGIPSILALPEGRESAALNEAIMGAQARAQSEPRSLEQYTQAIATAKKIISYGDNLYSRMMSALDSGNTKKFNQLQEQWASVAPKYNQARNKIVQYYTEAMPLIESERQAALASGDDVRAQKLKNEYYTAWHAMRNLGFETPTATATADAQRQEANRAEDVQLAQEAVKVRDMAQNIGLDQTTLQTVMSAYAAAISTNTQTALRFGNSIKTAAAQINEVNADLTVSEAEIQSDLQSYYDAMTRAVQAKDYAAFETAKEIYLRKFYVAQAKVEAVRLKASNKAESIRNSVIEVAEGLKTEQQAAIIKAQGGNVNGESALRSELRGNGRPERQTIRAREAFAGNGETQSRGTAGGTGSATGGTLAQTARQNQTDAGGRSNAGGLAGSNIREGARGTTMEPAPAGRITWGKASTPQAEQSIQKHIETVQAETGKTANVRIVTEISQELADNLQDIKNIAGINAPDVFLYESDDDYANGWTDETGIYVQINGKADPVFTYGHELGHRDAVIIKAGMSVIDDMTKAELAAYKAYRDAHISTIDNADIKSELVADMYGQYLYSATGAEVKQNFGLTDDWTRKFEDAFNDAYGNQQGAGETEGEVIDTVSQYVAKGDPEYSRVNFADEYGNELSYTIPTIHERTERAIAKGGERFYADTTINGEKKRLTNNDKAELEKQLNDLKKEQRMKTLSRSVQNLRAAAGLYSEGETVESYFNGAGDKADFGVARLLRAIYLRNGVNQGGALSDKEMFKILENDDQWKDKSAFSYGRETLTRNLEDIAPTKEEGRKLVDTYVTPIRQSVADMVRWMRPWAKRIAALKLNREESTMVQIIGENLIDEDVLRKGLTYENGKPMDVAKIMKAIPVFREFYDEALEKANAALMRNGYRPINTRNDYFPHMGEEFSDWRNFVEKVVKGGEHILPTEISGMTAIFKPGKPWFRNFLERKGDKTDYDAVRGFSNYLSGAGRVIFLTDSIQRIRQLEASIRIKYSNYNPDSKLTADEQKKHLTNFAAQLLEYGNQLAGKKAKIDRSLEESIGRKIFAWTGWLKKRFGANAVGMSISSALTNFIPLTQALSLLNKKDFARGMQSALSRQVRNDGLWLASDFLTSRFGTPDALVTKDWDKFKQDARNATKWLFETIDQFTAETIVFAKYAEGINKGLSEEKAMKAADEFAERVMAGRSIGSVPTLLNTKTLSFIAQFQLEVNNQLSFMMKDIPRSGDRKKVVKAFVQLFIYAFLYNELMEKHITGRRPAFDPIGTIAQAVEDFSTKKFGDAAFETGANIIEQLPFGNLFTGGGRIPLADAIEGANPLEAIRQTLNGEDSISAWETFVTAILSNFVAPVGGGQIRKSLQGVSAYSREGRYLDDRLAYPVDQSGVNFFKTLLNGPTAVAPQGYDYSTDILSKAKTETYEEMVSEGIDKWDAYNYLHTMDSGSNAGKLTSMVGLDADEDGKPDLSTNEMNIMAAVLGIKVPKGKTVPQHARALADEYIEDKRKDKTLSPEKKAKAEDYYETMKKILGR